MGLSLLLVVMLVTCLAVSSGQDIAACDSPPLVIRPHSAPHEFTSVNYPRPYPRNTYCEWLLEAPVGQKCNLTFVDFHLTGTNYGGKCPHTDKVQIYDGADAEANVTLFGTFCETDQPTGQYESRGRHLLVTFESTTINYFRRGIKVHYGFTQCTDAYECVSNPCQNGGTCVEARCGYNCTCARDYAGPTCQTELPCASSPCPPGTACINRGDAFSCTDAPTTPTPPTTTTEQATTSQSTTPPTPTTTQTPPQMPPTTTTKQPTMSQSTAATTTKESVTTRSEVASTKSQVTRATAVTERSTPTPDDPKITPSKTPPPGDKQTAPDINTTPPKTPPLAHRQTAVPTADSPKPLGQSGLAACETDVWNFSDCGWPWWLILVVAGLGVAIVGTVGGMAYRYCKRKKTDRVVTPRSVAGVHMELTDVDD
ncbi:uncharacterized protein [Branchiostoma lanceolatum]|uniref:JAG2 protein n=1 Tax=Branchiostoma lanceolatum TaxID=7740 RepID=A0A8J9ZXA5_BRALA|nr:JAG2 [Branchiostoma lanceolatum]